MNSLNATLGEMAALIGSLTVIGGALMWLFKKIISDPREKRKVKEEERRYARMLEVATSQNRPLSESIDQLTDWLDESRDDRGLLHKLIEQQATLIKQNSEVIKQMDDRLDSHSERILVLEVNGGIRHIKHKEVRNSDEVDTHQ